MSLKGLRLRPTKAILKWGNPRWTVGDKFDLHSITLGIPEESENSHLGWT